LLIGAAAIVLVAGGAGYYFLSQPTRTPSPPQTTGNSGPAELMTAGPLGEMWLGDEKAPVTIIEYASMTCPHCATFHETTYPELKKRYIDTGKVRFIFREFPLDPLAAAGFMLARCAGKDRYFPLIETLFQKQREWVVQQPLPPLLAIAKQAGFTQETFEACLSNQQVQDGIDEVRQRAVQKLNVTSTPTFFINGKIFRGAMTIADIEKEIAPYLQS
jgi:protein-disulfide isomerase